MFKFYNSMSYTQYPYNGWQYSTRDAKTHTNIIHTSIVMFNNFHNREKQLYNKFADDVVYII